jgi:hypothetical protein
MGCWHQAKTGWKRYGQRVGLAGAFRTECRIDRQLGGARLRAVFEGCEQAFAPSVFSSLSENDLFTSGQSTLPALTCVD